MNIDDRWTLQLSVSETDGETNAEARLVIDSRARTGHGRARLDPAKPGSREDRCGDCRGPRFFDLANKLLHAAAADVESMTHERVHLHV